MSLTSILGMAAACNMNIIETPTPANMPYYKSKRN